MAEKLREKWKSEHRKDFIRASAGETRNTTDGSINVLPESDLKLTMMSKERNPHIFSQFH